MLEEARALGGERYPLGVALEQSGAELGLELLHRRRDGRLRDAELDARMRDLAGIGGRDEIADLLERQRHIGFYDRGQLIFRFYNNRHARRYSSRVDELPL